MRRRLFVVGLAFAGVAAMAVTGGSATSPRPPGLIVFSDYAREGGRGNRELYSIRPDGSGRVQITQRATWASYPDLAANRRRVVFEHIDNRWPTIRLMTIGGTTRTVDEHDGGEYPTWSPDGSWIAYEVPLAPGSLGGPTNGPANICLVRPDGSEKRIVVNAGAQYDPSADQAEFAWSPDGSRIAFQAPAPNERYTVNVVDLASGAITRVGAGMAPDWSPRGDLIAFAQWPRSILVARLDGSGLRRVAAVPKTEYVYEPSWSHNGRRLAFYASDGSSDNWLYLVDSDGSHRLRVRLRPSYQGVGQARWSPDDRWLVFSDGLSLYRVRADGTSLTRLTSGSSPDWE